MHSTIIGEENIFASSGAQTSDHAIDAVCSQDSSPILNYCLVGLRKLKMFSWHEMMRFRVLDVIERLDLRPMMRACRMFKDGNGESTVKAIIVSVKLAYRRMEAYLDGLATATVHAIIKSARTLEGGKAY